MTLERELPYDVDPTWGAELHVFEPQVQNTGVEGLRMQMKNIRYNGKGDALTHKGYPPTPDRIHVNTHTLAINPGPAYPEYVRVNNMFSATYHSQHFVR